jgi:hypothetical protein
MRDEAFKAAHATAPRKSGGIISILLYSSRDRFCLSPTHRLKVTAARAQNPPMNIRTVTKPAGDFSANGRGADLLLAHGGDARIFLDPVTRRNRYGIGVKPCPGEICLSSSTASTITARAHSAVRLAWSALAGDGSNAAPSLPAWFENIRARLLALFGIAGAGVILAGSGTEAELIALAIAKNVLGDPLTNIVIAPAETGSGVLLAARGARFLDTTPFGAGGPAGDRLQGWAEADIETATIDIRDSLGDLRDPAAIDAQALEQCQAALAAGRSVLLHRLETSKTGRSGLTIGGALQGLAEAPKHVLVLVDCCQLRLSQARIRRFLQLGFMVSITGSKFFGGPPFSGALLVPPALMAGLRSLTLPAGLADYSARLDWPAELAARTDLRWLQEANLGLGLRWIAALEEMERFFALPGDMRAEVLAYFVREIRKRASGAENVRELADDPRFADSRRASILPFTMTHPAGAPFSTAEVASIHAELRSPCAALGKGNTALQRIFHLGQSVAVGSNTALRVCVGAAMISDMTERLMAGESWRAAFGDWGRDVDALFEKWAWLADEASARRQRA